VGGRARQQSGQRNYSAKAVNRFEFHSDNSKK
jgi:hypothetical protein